MKQVIQVAVLGAALLFALLGTYLVYFEDGDGTKVDEDGVAVYLATADQLRKITWTDEDRTLVIEKKNDGSDYLQVSVTTREEVIPELPVMTPADDTDVSDTDVVEPPPIPEPEIVESTSTFVGNEQAQKLWEDLAPFRADRELQGDSEADFGFEEPFATLEVERATGPVTVTFGASTYGDRARYITSDSKKFLVKKRTISRFESTDKLMERRLLGLEASDVERVELTANGQTRSFVQKNPDDRANVYWADPATADVRDAAASGFVPQLLSARAKAYVEAPSDAESVFSATATGEGETTTLEIFRTTGETTTYYAKSSFNRGWVELTPSQAETLAADLASVMEASGEE